MPPPAPAARRAVLSRLMACCLALAGSAAAPGFAGLAVLAMLGGCASGPAPARPRLVPPGADGLVETWWNDEQLKEQAEYRAGKRHGPCRAWHPNGQLAIEGDFVEGEPARTEAWSAEGELLARIAPATDGLRRVHEEFKGGTLRVRAERLRGRLDGRQQHWHEGGQPSAEGQCAAGQPVGRWLRWDTRGRLASETWYWADEGRAVGQLETVFDPQGRATTQTHLVEHDGLAIGRTTQWHENGRQAGLFELVGGLRHGRDVSWDAGGRRRAEGGRRDDLRQGAWTFWDAQGAVERVVGFDAGVEVGGPPLDLTAP